MTHVVSTVQLYHVIKLKITKLRRKKKAPALRVVKEVQWMFKVAINTHTRPYVHSSTYTHNVPQRSSGSKTPSPIHHLSSITTVHHITPLHQSL